MTGYEAMSLPQRLSLSSSECREAVVLGVCAD